ncbi:mucin-2 [Nymphalis io]|uniref:mucin-2 n=1 Tax=Inachis io TaxID=171585 RepID=UPI002169D77A|nr:mucin-2 [Nymphalis io]
MGNFDGRKYAYLKMEYTTWLFILIAAITLATPALSSSPRVVCYYTNWSVYRPGTAKFNPQNINPYLCTHLVYAFGGFTKDNTLKPFDKYQDIEKGGYAKFTGLKTYNKNLKTLLAIGGWNEGSSRFSPMVAAKDRRREFVRNVIKFLRQNHFDGLDLDWEYPAFRDGGKPKDRENYAKLVKELREEFERESEKTGKPRLLLTMAVPAGIEYIQKGFDVKTLNRYLDWMNLLTYDYHSAFEPAVNHHAPLYPLEEPNEYSVDNELNIDYTIKFYLENGADADKLVLGIPTYGRSYTLFNADAVEIGSPADGPGEQGDATREKGYLAYYEICEALKPKNKKRAISSDEEYEEDSSSDEDSEEEEEEDWTIMYPNKNAMGPVAYKGNQWVGYDDIDIVKKKGEYVAENGLGGIMFWSIDNDDFRGTCHGKPYPLIEAAKEAYVSKLGSTDRQLTVKEKPKQSRAGGRRRNRPKSSSTTTTTTTTTTTPKPTKSSKRKSASTSISTTPSWNIITPEPPTTPDAGSDFKCKEEGFFQHPRDCKKYFWCLDSGPSDLGIVAHQFTCPSGLYFNKAADSCDFARNVLCKKPTATTKAITKPTTAKTTVSTTTTTTTTTTTRRPIRLTSRSSLLFRTSSTTTTTPEPESSEEDEEEVDSDEAADIDSEDPKVIKELIDLIKKVGGVEQLEKQLKLSGTPGAAVTVPPSAINTKLYQRVLERTRGKNKYGDNSITENPVQNSRRGPQNAGIEPSPDKNRLLRKERPQYVTINRSRPAVSSTTPLSGESEEEEEEEESEEVSQISRTRVQQRTDYDNSIGTTAKPLQYVNIRRSRPTTAATDAPDDSRNALFERVEPYVAVAESPNSLDIASSRRENTPEYVTIRRTRPTAETTTLKYQESEEEKYQETALEREISSQSAQPQYTSVIRTRSTTLIPIEEPSSPEPTTILSVQISSLLNGPSSEEVENPPETSSIITQTTELPEPDTTTTSTTIITTTPTTTTTTPPPPPTLSTRGSILRRRGSTTPTTTAVPISTTQVSSRNYSFIRRRRPLSQPNEISESNEAIENVRKIRSTTPDSREVDGVKTDGNSGVIKRFRSRLQTSRNGDSIPAAASSISRGEFRPQLSKDEVISLTPIDVDSSEINENEEVTIDNIEKIRARAPTTIADKAEDSEVSAATIDERRPSIFPRGRGKFPSFTTQAIGKSVTTESSLNRRRPSFARFTPRPFARTISTTSLSENKLENEIDSVTQRTRSRLSYTRGRTQSSSVSPPIFQARKLPFPSRQSTTRPRLISENDDEEIDNKNDDITLSETAIEENEHDGTTADEESQKKSKTSAERLEIIPSEESSSDKNGKRKFRVIRRRPTPSTSEVPLSNTETTTAITRIRKIIRKKLKPIDDDSETVTKTVGLINAGFKDPPKDFINYGEKTRITTASVPSIDEYRTTTEIDEGLEQNTELLKEILPDTPRLQVQTETVIIEQDIETIKKDENKEVEEKIVTSEKEEKPEVVLNTEEMKLSLSDNKEPTLIKDDMENTETSTESASSLIEDNSKISQRNETDSESATTTENITRKIVVEEIATTELSLSETETSVETTTTSTTQLTSPSPRSRLPYRPPKRLFTSTTEATPSSSRTFSRKYNPGAYTSPSTVERPGFFSRGTTKRPLFSRTFTRRTFPTVRTTPKFQLEDEEEYSDEEILDEEPENPFVFVPPTKLFTRKPDSEEYDDDLDEEEETYNEEDDLKETPEEEIYEDEEPPVTFKPSSKRPQFKPKIINSNTFRTSTSTTEIPRRLIGNNQNKTTVYNRFGGNKPVNDTKKRVQNVPPGYNVPKSIQNVNLKNSTKQPLYTTKSVIVETTIDSIIKENEQTTTETDEYLYMTETSTSIPSQTLSSNDTENETETPMEIDNSSDDYLEFTTNYPSTQDSGIINQTDMETDTETVGDTPTTRIVENNFETTTDEPETTSQIAPVAPIVKTQFNKLFSISRVVEVSSKLDKHRLNKNNETTLIEEGKVMVEKKPTVDKIGEVSRYSLIKIVEDEIPIYLTKLGHVYPVDNPPDNPIRIDEARNARALVDYLDIPKENLVASESMNEGYRHINIVSDQLKYLEKGQVEHISDDDFLSYVNDDKKVEKLEDDLTYNSNWQFIPAAYENEKIKQVKSAKSFEVVTPRLMLTDPSTLPLEALFQTENPIMARKVTDDKSKQPFVVYSAPVPTQEEEANLLKIKIIKPQMSRSIETFARGKELKGPSVIVESTVKYPISISILKQSPQTTHINETVLSTTNSPPSNNTTFSTTTTNTQTTSVITENIRTSPIVELLTTTEAIPEQVMVEKITETHHSTLLTSTEIPVTTDTVQEEITTLKISALDAKRAKYGLPRRPIKPSNLTKFSSVTRTTAKINITPRTIQRNNKTSSFNPSISRFSGNRAQNIPVDLRKKSITPKVAKTFTTESPRSTTERKLFIKPIRPLRPSFVPKRFTTLPPTLPGDT